MKMWLNGLEQLHQFKKRTYTENSWIRELEMTEVIDDPSTNFDIISERRIFNQARTAFEELAA
jgi:hypothetical protein